MSRTAEFGTSSGSVTATDNPRFQESHRPSIITQYETDRRIAIDEMGRLARLNNGINIDSQAKYLTNMQNAQNEGCEIFDFVRTVVPLSPDTKELIPGIRRLRRRFMLDNEAVEASFVIVDPNEDTRGKVQISVRGMNSFFEATWGGSKTREQHLEYDKNAAGNAINVRSYQEVNDVTGVDTDFFKRIAEAGLRRKILPFNMDKGYQVGEEMEDELPRGPEGLTSEQEKLAGMIFDTKVEAPIGRRETNPDGSFTFSKETRFVSVLEFAKDDNEFAQADHNHNPGMPLSPYYFSFRNLPVDFRKQVTTVFSEMGPVKSDLITGIPNAGKVLAQDYAKFSGAQFVDIFEKVEFGNDSYILPRSGIRGDGDDICLVDDVLAQGNRKREAIDAARRAGLNVREIFFLVDRQQRHQLPEDIDVKCAMKLDQLLKYGIRTGRITEEHYERVMAFNALRDSLEDEMEESNTLIPHPNLNLE